MTYYKKGMVALIRLLLAAGLFILLFFGMRHWDAEDLFRWAWRGKMLFALSVAGTGALFLIANMLTGLFTKKPVILHLLTGMAILLQLFLVVRYPLQVNWDTNNTIVTAIGIIQNKPEWIDVSYFGMVQNQRMFLLTTVLFVKTAFLLGIKESSVPLFLSLISLLCTDGALGVMYFTVNRFKGKKSADTLLFLMLLHPGLYLWCGNYYTTNISLLILSGAVYFLLRLREGKGRILCSILWGALFMFGLYYRATIVILAVAAVVILTLKKPEGKLSFLAGMAGAGAAGILLVALLSKAMFSVWIPEPEQDVKLPASHWLMMAAQGNGSYNNDDVAYSESFSTYEERNRAATDRYLSRLKELGPKGCMSLAYTKLTYNWGYGDHDYHPESQRYDFLYDRLWGCESHLARGFQQLFHLLMIVLAIVTCLPLTKVPEKEGELSLILHQLLLLGALMFYILWETRPYYSVGFEGVFLVLAAQGLEQTESFLGERKRLTKVLLSAGAVVLLAGTVFLMKELLPPFETGEREVVTQLKTDIAYPLKGELTEITFPVERSFTDVQIWLGKQDKKSPLTGAYEISLVGPEGEEIKKEKLPKEDLQGVFVYDIHLDRPLGRRGETYKVCIRQKSDDEQKTESEQENLLQLFYYSLPVNPLPGSTLREDGKKVAGAAYLKVSYME
ncbi:MAG: glycosyltransferase family 39 protein [Lachnospiraceae bacterium]|nr:glycosyltransferase family 39 protein [Lachnospiraceae bacterium]